MVHAEEHMDTERERADVGPMIVNWLCGREIMRQNAPPYLGRLAFPHTAQAIVVVIVSLVRKLGGCGL
jgi:hypothetical protein